MSNNLRLFFFSILVFIIVSVSVSFAEVVLYDNIGLTREEITITVETKGRYFSKGGEVVRFVAEGKSIGNALSGGDGFAYRLFTPKKTGITQISVIYGKNRDTGIILSLRKGSSIVFVDVEGSLLSDSFSRKPIEKGREAIQNIIKKYPVVYLHSGTLGTKSIKQWLKKNSFPESAVMSWDNGSLFRDLKEKGFRLKAIIGSQAVIESAAEYKPLALSFDEFEGATHVKDWKEIEKRLK
ncbi:MAG: hypothetical protein A2X59_01830 [Nitrospirae bacterium GWC2_42_7]|nr:MAG: hypothetical protein A2X59_01830 [Nitrospirae bacterium GWC2_42_7]